MRSSQMTQVVESELRKHSRSYNALQDELQANTAEGLEREGQQAACFAKLSILNIESGQTFSADVDFELTRRKAEEAGLQAELVAIEERIAEANAELHESAAALAGAEEELTLALEGDTDYVAKRVELRKVSLDEAGFVATRRELLSECQRKLPPYRDNPIYSYLRNVGYMSGEYRGGRFARLIDGWLATLCSFEANSRQEDVLLKMQDALKDDSGALEQERLRLQRDLGKLERKIAADIGYLAVRERHAAALQAVESQKSEAKEIRAQLKLFAERKDQRSKRATDLLASALAGIAAEELWERAKETVDSADDDLVKAIETHRKALVGIREDRRRIESELRAAKSAKERASQMERFILSDRFVSSRYQYSDDLDIPALMAGYMAGAMSQKDIEANLIQHRSVIPREEPRQRESYYPSNAGGGGGGGGGGWGSSRSDDDADPIFSGSTTSGLFSSSSSSSFSSSSDIGGSPSSFSTSDSF